VRRSSQAHGASRAEDALASRDWPRKGSRAPTQVWGSSEAEGRKFEVTSERRGYARTLIYEPFDFDAEYARAFVGEEPGDPPARFASIPAFASSCASGRLCRCGASSRHWKRCAILRSVRLSDEKGLGFPTLIHLVMPWCRGRGRVEA
jgi:hypothetical protein